MTDTQLLKSIRDMRERQTERNRQIETT